MQRCIDLAAKAAGYVAPNPMVGSVLVCNDQVIGEGYHQRYGEEHAEVNCIKAAEISNSQLIADSTLYVSLEPCAHFGKTPPCADLIIEKKIKKIFVGCRDPFEQVNGKGIEKLQSANLDVTTGILEKECMDLNKRFLTFHTHHRPYIILKWAESSDKKISGTGGQRVFITGQLSNRLVHKWRSEEASILVGTNTALMDDPSLTTRLWKGNNPVRLVFDAMLRLPASLKVFDLAVRTIVFNTIKEEEAGNLQYVLINRNQPLPIQLAASLYRLGLQSVIIEGGSFLLQSFIDAGLWDEARVITNTSLLIGDGISSPVFRGAVLREEDFFQSDSIRVYTPDITKSA